MSYGIKLKVWGDYACFTRPEMKVERVSYDVMTPSAARGIIEAIYWKPEIRWLIDRIHILNPVRFTNVRRNELASVLSDRTVKSAMNGKGEAPSLFIENDRQQRAAMVLTNVAYIIEAHFEMKEGSEDNTAKHIEMFNRRARKGQCFKQPFLGTREFSANFELIENDQPFERLSYNKDLGFMLYDIDFGKEITPAFFFAKVRDGIMDVPPPDSPEVKR